MSARGLDNSRIKGGPLYTMAEAAKLLGTSSQTLIMYRKHGLVSPRRTGRSRLFSTNDIKWLRCVRELIHVDKISIEALKKLLEYAPCWEIKNCRGEHAHCTMPKDDPVSPLLRAVPARCPSWELSTEAPCLQTTGGSRDGK